MKKVIVFIIIMVMCFLLISCGQSSHTDGNENQVSIPEKTQPEETLNIDETKASVVEYDPILNNWPELFRISPPELSLTEIQEMVSTDLTIDEVADTISTLSDLIQYLHQKGYGFDHGDIQFVQDGYHWSVSRSAETVFERNKGNCGGGTNFVNYIMRGDFDEQGYIGESGNEGGHWYNYFKKEDKYYFFDLTQIVREGKYSPGYQILEFDSPQKYSEHFIQENHRYVSSDAFNYVLFQFMVEHEGSHGAKGDGDVRTPVGAPYANILPEQLKDKTTVLYVDEGMEGAVYVHAPERYEWPEEAQ